MKRSTILILLVTLHTVAAAWPGMLSFAQAVSPGSTDQADTRPNGESLATSAHRSTVAPPVFSGGNFPCSDCHAGMTPDHRQRALQDAHADIFLQHAAGQFWCLDCHHPESRDTLRLTSGASLPFTESYRLCGQCHARKLQDWQAGLHGKRTGHWNGDRTALLCTHCHNPHAPAFKKLKPLPPPERPGRTRRTGE